MRSNTGVSIADNAWWQRPVLSSRYIAESLLADKAIDLMDESAARLRWDHLQARGDR